MAAKKKVRRKKTTRKVGVAHGVQLDTAMIETLRKTAEALTMSQKAVMTLALKKFIKSPHYKELRSLVS